MSRFFYEENININMIRYICIPTNLSFEVHLSKILQRLINQNIQVGQLNTISQLFNSKHETKITIFIFLHHCIDKLFT